MLIFGWGSGSRLMGEIGLVDCPNCNNARNWIVVESSRRASVYFIPVAKWNRQYFCVCPVCDQGLELSGLEQAQDLLLESLEKRERSRIVNALLNGNSPSPPHD